MDRLDNLLVHTDTKNPFFFFFCKKKTKKANHIDYLKNKLLNEKFYLFFVFCNDIEQNDIYSKCLSYTTNKEIPNHLKVISTN